MSDPTDDVQVANIVMTGNLIVRNFLPDGLQDVSRETWDKIQEHVEPLGFSWADGKMRIPGELCAWWLAMIKGEPIPLPWEEDDEYSEDDDE